MAGKCSEDKITVSPTGTLFRRIIKRLKQNWK
jgi:hypothetical protein